ncbi:MAG: type II secretion system protein [Candidatus Hydrogenedentes bacterium]|nr:type II secretion system protein [Candidatus Hydrogenedentota bacterium]
MAPVAPHRAEPGRHGFTLIELIVVMTILALMLGVVVPLYQGSLTWVRTDRATRDFVALMKFAQERAISHATEYRFYMDYDTGAYWLMRLAAIQDGEKVFEDVPEYGGRRLLPEGLSLRGSHARNDRDREAHFIAFYATGACDYATVKLSRGPGETTTIDTKGRLGQLEVDEP